MKYDALVFDLDGTLWDACAAVAVGWTMGLKDLGFSKTITDKEIASICGLPTPDCVRKLCPEIKEENLSQAMDVLGRYEKKSLLQMGATLYPNVIEGLTQLQKKHRLFLVSNCQEWYLKSFFDLYQTSQFFEDWECHGRTNKSKGENLKSLATRNKLQRPIYFGDTESDFHASRVAGYDFGFAAYGFGKVQTSKNYNKFTDLVEEFR